MKALEIKMMLTLFFGVVIGLGALWFASSSRYLSLMSSPGVSVGFPFVP